MNRQLLRGLLVGAVAVLIVGLARPADAQNGSLRGKVVDDAGKPVPEVELVLDFVGDYNRQLKAITDKNGEWVRAGMPAGGGTWTITAKKGNLVGRLDKVRVSLGDMTRLADIVLRPPGAAAARAPVAASKEEAEKRNKRQAELQKLFEESNAAIEAGNYDDAITKLTAIVTEIEKCAACHTRIGDVYLKKKDLVAAEKSYLKAIEIDPNDAGPYGALATVYNELRRFDDAVKMSTKANELLSAGGGGGDASTVFNQGIIFWNQSKIAEAKALFEKAFKLDPKLAEAHYWFGMALVNEGKMADAKAPFQEYLKLAPTGQYAATAKAILDTIK